METCLSCTVVTYRTIEACTEFRRVCFRGNDVDNATGGVTTVESTLRTTKCFYTLHVKVLRLKDSCIYLVDTVYVDTHTRITERTNCARADTTNTDILTGEVALGNSKVRHRKLHR